MIRIEGREEALLKSLATVKMYVAGCTAYAPTPLPPTKALKAQTPTPDSCSSTVDADTWDTIIWCLYLSLVLVLVLGLLLLLFYIGVGRRKARVTADDCFVKEEAQAY